MSRQSEKILKVANALGLTDLRNMQASTGTLYDTIPGGTRGTFFKNVAQKVFPATNLTDNRFEVNEAFLVEGIAIYTQPTNGTASIAGIPATIPPINIRLNFSIANKVVLKDILLGSIVPQAAALKASGATTVSNSIYYIKPGLLIPPGLNFSAEFESDTTLGGVDSNVGCVIYGTRVLTNLGTSI
jgi:hypothetical protein